MSYPKKISRETILDCALAFVESQGMAALSMRTLASNLGVSPNALYRYFGSKAELEFALVDKGGHMLLAALEEAARGLSMPDAIKAVSLAYIRFARAYPQLYAVKLQHNGTDQCKTDSHDALWGFVSQLMSGLPTRWDEKDLALSLWAFLHGMVELDRADLLEGRSPEATMGIGLDIMLAGLMAQLQAPR